MTPDQSSSTTDQTGDDDKVDLGAPAKSDDAPADDAGDKTDADADSDKTDEKAVLFGAPEGDAAYELTLPDGVEVDKAALEAVAPVARELNLSNEGLSRIAAVYAEKVLPSVVERYQEQLSQNITAQHSTWENQAQTAIKSGTYEDDALGAVELKNANGDKLDFDGRSIKEVQRIAAKALDKFAPPQLREFLNRDNSGLGLHPLLITFAYQAGKSIAEEENFEPSGGATAGPTSREDKYYKTT